MTNENFTTQRPTPIDKEVVWDKTKTIMSKTDKYGTIEYANEVFSDVSGYEDYELMAQPHSIIRHPDMPRVIFKVLWDNIQKGVNFHAVVKNMAKTGRYYWVITDFEVAKDENGEIVNYFARRKAVPDEVVREHFEPLYKRLLQIEKVSGMDASEKYLIGFLEERNMGYMDFVREKIMEHEQKLNLEKMKQQQVEEEEENVGFFRRFFGMF